jgi:hypothetical protein
LHLGWLQLVQRGSCIAWDGIMQSYAALASLSKMMAVSRIRQMIS